MGGSVIVIFRKGVQNKKGGHGSRGVIMSAGKKIQVRMKEGQFWSHIGGKEGRCTPNIWGGVVMEKRGNYSAKKRFMTKDVEGGSGIHQKEKEKVIPTSGDQEKM